jgi:hypothetical protein
MQCGGSTAGEAMMDWKWLLGDAEFYVEAIAALVAYVLVIAVVFAGIERLLASFGIRLGEPPKPTEHLRP